MQVGSRAIASSSCPLFRRRALRLFANGVTDNSAQILNVDNFAKLDINRDSRAGFPEAIFGTGKAPKHFAKIMVEMQRKLQGQVIGTRVEKEQVDALRDILSNQSEPVPEMAYYEDSKICTVGSIDRSKTPLVECHVAVLCAGTADYRVAEEAAKILELSSLSKVTRLYDVGVAGLNRLLGNLHIIQSADVIIVCAGMDGALPSVVGGLVKAPVIAVPTSVGYGASFGGVAAMLTMLNSCAPGVSVVNIDNGFGAAVTAYKMSRLKNP